MDMPWIVRPGRVEAFIGSLVEYDIKTRFRCSQQKYVMEFSENSVYEKNRKSIVYPSRGDRSDKGRPEYKKANRSNKRTTVTNSLIVKPMIQIRLIKATRSGFNSTFLTCAQKKVPVIITILCKVKVNVYVRYIRLTLVW